MLQRVSYKIFLASGSYLFGHASKCFHTSRIASDSSIAKNDQHTEKRAPLQPSTAEVLARITELARLLSPLNAADVAFGLQAVAQEHIEKKLEAEPENGTPVHDEQLMLSLLDDVDIAHATYAPSSHMACAMCSLKVQDMALWRTQAGRFQPAHFIAIDHDKKRVVWAIRGTKVLNDILVNLAGTTTDLPQGGHAHWGMYHTASYMLHNELGLVKNLLRTYHKYTLHIVGHSLGGGIAALMAFHLSIQPQLSEGLLWPGRLSATAVAPPCCVTAEAAAAMRGVVTSLALSHDIVPRFNFVSGTLLKEQVARVDWYNLLKQRMLEHEYVQGIQSVFASVPTAASARLAEMGQSLLRNEALASVSAALDNMRELPLIGGGSSRSPVKRKPLTAVAGSNTLRASGGGNSMNDSQSLTQENDMGSGERESRVCISGLEGSSRAESGSKRSAVEIHVVNVSDAGNGNGSSSSSSSSSSSGSSRTSSSDSISGSSRKCSESGNGNSNNSGSRGSSLSSTDSSSDSSGSSRDSSSNSSSSSSAEERVKSFDNEFQSGSSSSGSSVTNDQDHQTMGTNESMLERQSTDSSSGGLAAVASAVSRLPDMLPGVSEAEDKMQAARVQLQKAISQLQIDEVLKALEVQTGTVRDWVEQLSKHVARMTGNAPASAAASLQPISHMAASSRGGTSQPISNAATGSKDSASQPINNAVAGPSGSIHEPISNAAAISSLPPKATSNTANGNQTSKNGSKGRFIPPLPLRFGSASEALASLTQQLRDVASGFAPESKAPNPPSQPSTLRGEQRVPDPPVMHPPGRVLYIKRQWVREDLGDIATGATGASIEEKITPVKDGNVPHGKGNFTVGATGANEVTPLALNERQTPHGRGREGLGDIVMGAMSSSAEEKSSTVKDADKNAAERNGAAKMREAFSLLELAQGEHVQVVLLTPQAITDHKCETYRYAMLRMLCGHLSNFEHMQDIGGRKAQKKMEQDWDEN